MTITLYISKEFPILCTIRKRERDTDPVGRPYQYRSRPLRTGAFLDPDILSVGAPKIRVSRYLQTEFPWGIEETCFLEVVDFLRSYCPLLSCLPFALLELAHSNASSKNLCASSHTITPSVCSCLMTISSYWPSVACAGRCTLPWESRNFDIKPELSNFATRTMRTSSLVKSIPALVGGISGLLGVCG